EATRRPRVRVVVDGPKPPERIELEMERGPESRRESLEPRAVDAHAEHVAPFGSAFERAAVERDEAPVDAEVLTDPEVDVPKLVECEAREPVVRIVARRLEPRDDRALIRETITVGIDEAMERPARREPHGAIRSDLEAHRMAEALGETSAPIGAAVPIEILEHQDAIGARSSIIARSLMRVALDHPHAAASIDIDRDGRDDLRLEREEVDREIVVEEAGGFRRGGEREMREERPKHEPQDERHPR